MKKKITDINEYAEAKQQYDAQVGALRAQELKRQGLESQLTQILQIGKDHDSRAQALLRGELVDPTPLRVQIASIDTEAPIRLRAVEITAKQLARVKDEVSQPECAEVLPTVVVEIRKILEANKQIRAANQRLMEVREDLESRGFSAASIPPAIFTGLGSESDHQLGQSVDALYEKYVRENFKGV